METYNIRQYAYEMLFRILEEGRYTNLVLKDSLSLYVWLTDREKRFLTRLVNGTAERQIHLDYVIGQYSSVKVKKLKPMIRTVLRMSAYQILYMDSIPSYSVVNEAVKMVRKSSLKNLAGFVNAVLRKIADNQEKEYENEPAWQRLCLPEWLYAMWSEQYGDETTQRIAEAFLSDGESSLTIRRRLTGQTAEEFEEKLDAEGFSYTCVDRTHGIYRLSHAGDLAMSEMFSCGDFFVQDHSSILACLAADPAPGSLVLDCCAAPGGKSVALADLMGGSGTVLARDIEEGKRFLVEESIERSGFTNIRFETADASVPDESLVGQCDVVLADLPCSGLGVLAKKPDIRMHATAMGVADLAVLQRRILDTVQSYVKPGGVLVFSTCTINKLENDLNRKWLLEHSDFEPASIAEYLPEVLGKVNSFEPAGNEITAGQAAPVSSRQIFPYEYDGDGFYIAKFRRKSNE